MADLTAMAEAVERGDRENAVRLVKEALAEKTPAEKILNEGLIAAMSSVGQQFTRNEIFIPEMLIAARAMTAALLILEPVLVKSGVQPRGKVVIGTVKQDLHDIGKNLVAMMLKGAGYRIVDMGIDVAPEKFVEAVKVHKAGIIALSAMLTTTMTQMKTTVDAVRGAGLGIYVIIGGAPVTQEYAARIHADGYASDAAGAVAEVGRLLF